MNLVLAAVLSVSAAALPAQTLPSQSPPAGTTRVAVVNIGHVFNKYERAIRFKADLEDALKPYKDRAAKLTKNIQKCEEAIAAKRFRDFSKEEYEEKIVQDKRELEDMSREISKLLGKKQEENLVTLWKEVNLGISAYASTHKIDLVIGYGDPIEKELLDQFPNVNRKMQAMDTGSTVPLFIGSRADISEPVVQLLNRWARDAKKSVPKTDAD